MEPSTTCRLHTWASVVYNATERHTHCTVCGVRAPPIKRVVCLRVLNRRVVCPFGKNDHNGGKDLHDCYLQSITPGHACVDPLGTGASRCPQIQTFHKQYGWRTFYRAVEIAYARYGAPHKEHPLRVIYSSINQEGTAWMAINQRTGQRLAVVLHGTAPHRRTPEGADVEQVYRNTRMTDPSAPGIAQFQHTEPIWNGVPSREDQPACNCRDCQEQNKSTGATMTAEEFTTLSGVHIFGAPKPDRALIKLADCASAPILGGDPNTCIDCRYARCRTHRMAFLPTTDEAGRRIIAHAGDFATRPAVGRPLKRPRATIVARSEAPQRAPSAKERPARPDRPLDLAGALTARLTRTAQAPKRARKVKK